MALPQPTSECDAYADRRGALRHPVQVDSVVSTPTAVHRSVTLFDISEHGCQIARPTDLANGTQLSLSFGGFAPFDAIVVWTSPTAAGLRFDQPIHPALIASVVAAAKGRRKNKAILPGALVRRTDRARPAQSGCPVTFEIDAPGQSWDQTFAATLRDLTVDGCQLSSEVALMPGTQLKLTISGRQPVVGVVRWCENDAIGVLFFRPLSGQTVNEILQGTGALR